MRRRVNIVLFLSLCIAFPSINGAVKTVNKVEQQKNIAQKEIKETTSKIYQNTRQTKNQLNQLNLINAEILEQNKVINDLGVQVNSINKKVQSLNDSINRYDKKLALMRNNYIKAIKKMRCRGTQANQLLFVFSSESFRQAFRRVRYLREFSKWRKGQSEAIQEVQSQLRLKRESIEMLMNKKQTAMSSLSQNKQKLEGKKKDQANIVNQLQAEGSNLQAYLKEKETQYNSLDRELNRLIAEEERKAAERARIAEEKRLAEQRRIEAQRKMEQERQLAEERRKAEEQRVAEAQRMAQAQREAQKAQEAKDLAQVNIRKQAEERAKLNTAKKQAEDKRAQEAKLNAAKKQAEERQKQEAKLNAKKQAEERKIQEARAKQEKELQKKRLAEQKAVPAPKSKEQPKPQKAVPAPAPKPKAEAPKAVPMPKPQNNDLAINIPPKPVPEKKKQGPYIMDQKEEALSGSFESNKGRLLSPVTASYKIVKPFGRQRHPELRHVETNNGGIDIETTAGANARAVFDGKVSVVFKTDGFNTIVMLRHGTYLTVYVNLEQSYVSAGQTVKAGQSLGKIFSDPDDHNRTILHFEIRKEKEKLNPQSWIK